MKFTKLLQALLLLASAPAYAQTLFPISLPAGTEGVAVAIAEDGETGMTCRYIGTNASGKIAVAAGGDLTFTDGASGSEAATSTFECPVSGALGGVIDVSDTACNTMGEVVDIVNASSNWRCVLASSLRSDSSDDTLVAISATAATDPKGLKLKVDSSVALISTLVVAPIGWDDYDKLNNGNNSTTFKQKPWSNSRAVLEAAYALSTYGSGTSLISVIAVDRTQAAAGSETATTIWPATAGGATTVAKVFGSCSTPATGCDTAWGPGGIIGPPGQQLMLRLTNSAALSVNTLAVNGLFFPNNGLGLKGVQ